MKRMIILVLMVMSSALWAEKLNLSLGANFDFEQWIAEDYNKKSQYDISTLSLDVTGRLRYKRGYFRGKVSYFMLPLMMSYQDALAVDEKNYGEDFWKLGTDIRLGYGYKIINRRRHTFTAGAYLSFRIMYFLKPVLDINNNLVMEPFSFNSGGAGLFTEYYYHINKTWFVGVNAEAGYNYLPFGNRPLVPDHGYGANAGVFVGIKL